jgi:hypothetical protein
MLHAEQRLRSSSTVSGGQGVASEATNEMGLGMLNIDQSGLRRRRQVLPLYLKSDFSCCGFGDL